MGARARRASAWEGAAASQARGAVGAPLLLDFARATYQEEARRLPEASLSLAFACASGGALGLCLPPVSGPSPPAPRSPVPPARQPAISEPRAEIRLGDNEKMRICMIGRGYFPPWAGCGATKGGCDLGKRRVLAEGFSDEPSGIMQIRIFSSEIDSKDARA